MTNCNNEKNFPFLFKQITHITSLIPLGKRYPERDAGHSSGDDVYPEVLHDVAGNLSDLVENAAVWGSHESQCVHPGVRTVDVDAAGFAVVADDVAGEEQADDDGCKVRKPDAVEHGREHFVVDVDGRLGNAF